jgi:hypothetical protein
MYNLQAPSSSTFPPISQHNPSSKINEYTSYFEDYRIKTLAPSKPVIPPGAWRRTPFITPPTPFTPLLTPSLPSISVKNVHPTVPPSASLQSISESQPQPASIGSTLIAETKSRVLGPLPSPRPRPFRRTHSIQQPSRIEQELRRSSRKGSQTDALISEKRIELKEMLRGRRSDIIELVSHQQTKYTTAQLSKMDDLDLLDLFRVTSANVWAVESYWKVAASLRTLEEIVRKRKIVKEEEKAGKGYYLEIYRFGWKEVRDEALRKRKAEEEGESDARETEYEDEGEDMKISEEEEREDMPRTPSPSSSFKPPSSPIISDGDSTPESPPSSSSSPDLRRSKRIRTR